MYCFLCVVVLVFLSVIYLICVPSIAVYFVFCALWFWLWFYVLVFDSAALLCSPFSFPYPLRIGMLVCYFVVYTLLRLVCFVLFIYPCLFTVSLFNSCAIMCSFLTQCN